VSLDEELRRIAEVAVTYCRDGEELAGIIPAEPGKGGRVYVCAYSDEAETSWLVLDASAKPVEDRGLVNDAVSIAALCEVAAEAVGDDDETRVSSGALLDELGAASGPEVAGALRATSETVRELLADVQRGYKLPLS
jgi:hypothetical protein